MITVDEHRSRIQTTVSRLPATILSIHSAAGLVLAEDVTNRWPVPLFDNSAMDGYAVRRVDAAVGATLKVVADVPAGSPDDPPIGAGEAVRIMTGAPVPTDADAIVPLEHTDLGTEILATPPDSVTVTVEPKPHAHIRRSGEDAPAGAVAVSAGTVLGPWQVSAIASAGHDRVLAYRRPRVAVISTGTELVEPSQTPRRGQIPESNSVLLSAAVAEAGAEVGWTATVEDDEEALRRTLADPDVDAVVLTGGASVGAFDVVKAVLNGVVGIEFTTVAMQPGKPQGFGLLGVRAPSAERTGIPVFCLPGNPVSVAVSFEMFVRPALRKMAGHTDLDRPRVVRRAATGWRSRADRVQILPAVADAQTVRPASRGGSGSHLVSSLADASALAIVPADVVEIFEGDPVTVMVLS
ncbi:MULTISPECIES: molybdopterin molybdotransferase MoeA [Gordonia]|uniref:Molybdopterin molybdenumtransferase n=1 Tax=Gordonia sihwensis NBRC 108236 TaxID=1223544 RepID=L7LHP1_9ACTN|nr:MULTISPECIES: gephyrin-like molybdotransferase Glp [Gordonia]AUH68185.1 molybdopterin molybdenumtransferase MoeA [Gordonia sp. YC-JH1]GAC60261.1 molybdopterin biosynthesis protein MoeA [Gordonia sihwensis NBRC 108236]